ncbi:hypothetical protein AB5J49_07755 [Streptomyces sp. R28]|uniref:Uncharacterized protein n=1 Tax=Streptomyces sp. R28 TaxID=3238628 RepID=A0AB39PRN5_9ACTN
MADIDFPADLLALARASWEEQQRSALTVATAAAVHAAVGAYAEEAGLLRIDVELGLKQAVRHANDG